MTSSRRPKAHDWSSPKDVTARNLLDMPPENLGPYMLALCRNCAGPSRRR